MVLGNLAENIWKYGINDIGIPYLLFIFIGYTFFGVILWTMVGVNDDNSKLGAVDNSASVRPLKVMGYTDAWFNYRPRIAKK